MVHVASPVKVDVVRDDLDDGGRLLLHVGQAVEHLGEEGLEALHGELDAEEAVLEEADAGLVLLLWKFMFVVRLDFVVF